MATSISVRATAVAATLALAGCASIFNGTTQSVAVQSVPEGATVRVVNRAGETVHVATTPTRLVLNRGAGYFRPEAYTARFSKEGYPSAEVPIAGRMSGWYVGNLLFGGLIGMVVVDPLTGGMYTFEDGVTATLGPRVAVDAAAPAAGTAPQARSVPVSLPGGTNAYGVERMPELAACTPAPRALLVAKGPGFETYSVGCRDGNAVAVRCEFGSCRILQ